MFDIYKYIYIILYLCKEISDNGDYFWLRDLNGGRMVKGRSDFMVKGRFV